MDESSGVVQVACAFHEVRYSPTEQPCPGCQTAAPRVWDVVRIAIDARLDGLGLLRVHVGVYRCRGCARYFRAAPPFLRRGATYTRRVVDAAVHAVFTDGMAVERVPARRARDLRVRPSVSAVRAWCRTYAATQTLDDDYTAWVVRSFSGVLCVDEVYQGRLALLLAVDPRAADGDRLVGYQLVEGAVSQAEVEAFLARLRDAGVVPAQVVTDGAAIYPEVIATVWPNAVHQLCLFHETRHVVASVLRVVPTVRRAVPTPPRAAARSGRLRLQNDPTTPQPIDRDARIALVQRLRRDGLTIRAITRQTGHSRNTIRAWLRGQVTPATPRTAAATDPIAMPRGEPPPPPPDGWRSWDAVRTYRQALRDHRTLLVTRRAQLAPADHVALDDLLAAPVAAPLRTAHRWMQDWYAIWHDDAGARRARDEAQRRFEVWRRDPEVATVPALARLQRRMTPAHFTALSHFLEDPQWEATSNGAERMGRAFRHHQGPHFCFRTPAQIAALLDVAANARRVPRAAGESASSSRGRRRVTDQRADALAA